MLLHLLLLLQFPHLLLSYQFKVGELNSWGPPPSSNPKVYAFWSQYHNLTIGDSLFFLYPPSQDSVIQVTERAFNACDISDPILKMPTDGNSVFNLTAPGYFYFTSGVPGRCEKRQKLAVAVPSANGTFFPPQAEAPAGAAADSSPFPVVFGPSAAQASGAVRRRSAVVEFAVAAAAAAMSVVMVGLV